MNIFEDLEGKSGECLASAALGHLIVRSADVRSAVLKFIAGKLRVDTIATRIRFACQCEWETHHPIVGSGKIDLLIETDTAVIGIENKFFAEFSESQPEKYITSLEERARLLSNETGTVVNWHMILLVPRQRVSDAEARTASMENVHVTAWQDLLDALERTASEMAEADHDLLSEFKNYVLRRIAYLDGFIDTLKKWPDREKLHVHTGFLTGIKNAIPLSVGVINHGPSWIGYYLRHVPGERPLGWLGFVSAERIEGGIPGRSYFIIATSVRNAPAPSAGNPVSMQVPISLLVNIFDYRDAKYHWQFTIDERWRYPEFIAKQFEGLVRSAGSP